MKAIILCVLFSMYPAFSYGLETCHLPNSVKTWNYRSVDAVRAGRDWKNDTTPTDSWVLALSWSKAYCDRMRHKGKAGFSAHQCKDNNFGLIVHGLWAQSARGKGDFHKHPRNCRDAKAIGKETLKQHLCMMPDTRLIQMEWEKHGTCNFKTPEDYLQQTAQVFQQLTLPSLEELRELERKRASVIRKSFVGLNRHIGLSTHDVWVKMYRGRLSEIHVCYDMDFKFARCR